ncbi:hypothetical protein GWI33_016686 [Rhynchophorus ferrugineus]|uniref:Uncharacterized protein n=1 Tax=Rhynchophorus ferrugineus TaxID=354439 RepID=A0A834M8F3_RHYFE|nr:hypothetical protein GWI33_016686 [Rhynchophorus ferrugineus]
MWGNRGFGKCRESRSASPPRNKLATGSGEKIANIVCLESTSPTLRFLEFDLPMGVNQILRYSVEVETFRSTDSIENAEKTAESAELHKTNCFLTIKNENRQTRPITTSVTPKSDETSSTNQKTGAQRGN